MLLFRSSRWPHALLVLATACPIFSAAKAATVRRGATARAQAHSQVASSEGRVVTALPIHLGAVGKQETVYVDWTARRLRAEATGLSPVAAGEPQQLAPRSQARADAKLRAGLSEAIRQLPLGGGSPPADLQPRFTPGPNGQTTVLRNLNLSPTRLVALERQRAKTAEPEQKTPGEAAPPDGIRPQVIGTLVDEGAPLLQDQLAATVGRYQVEETTFLADGSVHLSVVLPFDGGQESMGGFEVALKRVRPLAATKTLKQALVTHDRINRHASRVAPRAITGLVINAKGLGATPCLWPRLYASDGRLLVGAETLEDNVLMARGVASFSHSLDAALRDPRVAEQAVVVRAQERLSGSQADLVLNRDDLPDDRQLGPLLEEARLIIVIDATG